MVFPVPKKKQKKVKNTSDWHSSVTNSSCKKFNQNSKQRLLTKLSALVVSKLCQSVLVSEFFIVESLGWIFLHFSSFFEGWLQICGPDDVVNFVTNSTKINRLNDHKSPTRLHSRSQSRAIGQLLPVIITYESKLRLSFWRGV